MSALPESLILPHFHLPQHPIRLSLTRRNLAASLKPQAPIRRHPRQHRQRVRFTYADAPAELERGECASGDPAAYRHRRYAEQLGYLDRAFQVRWNRLLVHVLIVPSS